MIINYLLCNIPIDIFEVSDWIDIASIVVNFFLAIWIVTVFQDKLNNKRVLKDHLINEVKDIRDDYRTFLNILYSNKSEPSQIAPWFKLMNIKINDILDLISKNHSIDRKILYPYQVELRDIITEFDEYIDNYISNTNITLLPTSQLSIIQFEQRNNHIFNDIIVIIND